MNRFYLITHIIVLMIYSNSSWAASRIEIDPDSAISITVDKKNLTCTTHNNQILVGVSIASNLIKPYSTIVKRAKKKSKSKKSNKKRFKKLRKIQNKAEKLCENTLNNIGIDNPNDNPTTEGNFDSNGEVTDSGKNLFGIPTQLTANVNTGLLIYQQNCSGCHSEKRNRSFSEYRTNIKRAPMFYDEGEITDQMLADLVAYLNRFRQNTE